MASKPTLNTPAASVDFHPALAVFQSTLETDSAVAASATAVTVIHQWSTEDQSIVTRFMVAVMAVMADMVEVTLAFHPDVDTAVVVTATADTAVAHAVGIAINSLKQMGDSARLQKLSG